MGLDKEILQRMLKKRMIIDQHFKRNEKLLEELRSLKYDDNFEKFIEKCLEFKNDQKLLNEKINDFREELIKLGVPPELVL